MTYKGYEIESVIEHTFSNGDKLELYHIKKDGQYFKENLLSLLACKIQINYLIEMEDSKC